MDSTLITIRMANSKDLGDVCACAKAAYAKYVARMDREPAPMNADFEALIDAGHVRVADLCAAETESRISSRCVGYVVFYPQGSDALHLENIAVFPHWAGQGIGKALIDYVERSGLQQGLRFIELYTNEAMTENLALYPALGYQEVARKTQQGFARVFYQKAL